MSDRYIITSRNFDNAIVWYVKDSRVPAGGEPAIVARCGNQADAGLVRDALNGPAIVEAFLEHWLRERMQASDSLIAIAVGDFREWWSSRAKGDNDV